MNPMIAYIQSKTNLSEQEVWWMLESITNKTKEQLVITNDLSIQEKIIIDQWIEKLTTEQIPLAYLIGWIPFLDLSITTKPPILIPRHETEEWVHNVISSLIPYKKSIKSILDIGTGSGCIALAFAKNFPQAQVTAIDINPTALKLAQENAIKNNIKNIVFLKSDLFKTIQNQCFDLIVSNPPYIDPNDTVTIMPQVTQWEDKQALFANNEGLEIIENIMKHAPQYLCKDSILPYQLIIEYGYNQKESIEILAKKYHWNYSIHKDLFGNFRTIRLSLP